MNSPQFIYNLVSMSEGYIQAWTRYRNRQDAYQNLSIEERKEFDKNNSPVEDPEMDLGKAYRGSFINLDKLIQIIEAEDDCYGICECYYTYLLIERVHTDRIDSVDWEWDGEIWYKMNEDYRYIRIEKPDCFRQTCNFT